MSQTRLPVVAAIPNYNMGEQLGELLPEVAKQDYAAIFVLDDASNDHSRDITRDFDKAINFVAGVENLGAGANRNRIIPALGFTAIVHFIDADMQLQTERVPELAQEVLATDQIGFVGGLIRSPDGGQHPFNYGPRQSLYAAIAANVQNRVCAVAEKDVERARELRAKHNQWLQDLPDPLSEPQARRVFWNAEANLLIRSDVFAGLGGFDPELRDQEVQDLAIRMEDKGLERRFDPVLSALHKAAQVRLGNRALQMAKAELYIARKHGFRNWLRPNGSFRPEL